MTKVLYNFENVITLFENLKKQSVELDGVMDGVNSFSCDIVDIISALDSAKAKTNNSLIDLKTLMEDNANKYITLCNDYQSFESKMMSHSIFGLDFKVDLVSVPSTIASVEVTGETETKLDNTNIQYKIKQGDSLSKIAKAYNTTVESIVAANPNKIKDIDLIHTDDTLIVPQSSILENDNESKQPINNISNQTVASEAKTSSSNKKEDSDIFKSAQSEVVENDSTNNLSGTIYSSNQSKGFVVTTSNKTYNLSNNDFDLLCAIVAAESDKSLDDALAVASTILNRCENKAWVNSHGSNPISQAIAPNQFVVYQEGIYKKYLNGNIPNSVKVAVTDALNGTRNHSYLSFRSNASVKYSNNMITSTGNRYA